jgi:hypothetical protein
MTTEAEIKEFIEYTRRLGPAFVPQALREDAPIPQTWPYDPEAWRELAQEARVHLASQRAYEFARGIALLGFYPDEVASDRPHPGCEVNVATGEAIRHRPEHDEDTIARAREALRGLRVVGIHLDGIMEATLQRAAAGAHAGSPKTLAKIISAAESAIQNEYARRKAAAREEAARPVLTVRFRFKTHKQYEPGIYRIPVQEAEELERWRERMESDRDIHEWGAPQGFNETNWPPFTLEGVPEPVVAEEASGQFV